jgi:hypothetical protein
MSGTYRHPSALIQIRGKLPRSDMIIRHRKARLSCMEQPNYWVSHTPSLLSIMRTGCLHALSGPIFEIKHNADRISNPLIFHNLYKRTDLGVSTLQKAGHREYRPKRVVEKARVGIGLKRVGTLDRAGRPAIGGLGAKKNGCREPAFFICWRRER